MINKEIINKSDFLIMEANYFNEVSMSNQHICLESVEIIDKDVKVNVIFNNTRKGQK